MSSKVKNGALFIPGFLFGGLFGMLLMALIATIGPIATRDKVIEDLFVMIRKQAVLLDELQNTKN